MLKGKQRKPVLFLIIFLLPLGGGVVILHGPLTVLIDTNVYQFYGVIPVSVDTVVVKMVFFTPS